MNKTWIVAAEEYDDLGSLQRVLPGTQQFH
jgi:hypothetical protein